MLAVIEAVAMPPDGKEPGRPVQRYAYTQKECDDAPVKGDSVQDANLALRIIKGFCGDSIKESMPPRGKEYQPLYVIAVQIYGTHRDVTHYRTTYHKFNGCPLNVIEDMMDIYATVKRSLRDCRKDYLDAKAEKKARKASAA